MALWGHLVQALHHLEEDYLDSKINSLLQCLVVGSLHNLLEEYSVKQTHSKLNKLLINSVSKIFQVFREECLNQALLGNQLNSEVGFSKPSSLNKMPSSVILKAVYSDRISNCNRAHLSDKISEELTKACSTLKAKLYFLRHKEVDLS